MHLLQGGVAPEVIALWLGHENPNTTHLYVEADLNMKSKGSTPLLPQKANGVRRWSMMSFFGSWRAFSYGKFEIPQPVEDAGAPAMPASHLPISA